MGGWSKPQLESSRSAADLSSFSWAAAASFLVRLMLPTCSGRHLPVRAVPGPGRAHLRGRRIALIHRGPRNQQEDHGFPPSGLPRVVFLGIGFLPGG